MKVVGELKLDQFGQRHADARGAIAAWLAEAKAAKWETTVDIKAKYASASFLPENVVVFNLKGNHYRLEVQVAFHTGIVVVKRIGTHAEYNRWNR